MNAKKLIAGALSLGIMGTNFISMNTNAAEILYSGECGDNASWTLDSDGLFTVIGTGEITDWGYTMGRYLEDGFSTYWSDYEKIVPWYYDRELIKEVIISEGITHIGTASFIDCDNLVSVSLPDSLRSTEWSAFMHCDNLKEIKFPDGMEKIGSDTVGSCDLIKTITVPASVIEIGIGAFGRMEGLERIYFLNKDCEIYDYNDTVSSLYNKEIGEYEYYGTIYGWEGSTAQAYAEKYGYAFSSIDDIGDINFDGAVDALDASLVLTEYAASATGKPSVLDDTAKLSADINYDGAVDALDASSILSCYAHKATGGKGSILEFI